MDGKRRFFMTDAEVGFVKGNAELLLVSVARDDDEYEFVLDVDQAKLNRWIGL